MPPKTESVESETSKASKVSEPIKKKVVIKKKVTIAEPEKEPNLADSETVVKVEEPESASSSMPTKMKITKKKVATGVEPVDEEKDKSKQRETTAMSKDGKNTGGEEVLLDIAKSVKSKKTSKKQDNQEIFNEDDVDYRFIMMNYDFSKNKTLPKITKYEKALLVGKRAKQIEEGANPNVKVLPGQNTIEIAEEELRQRKIPFIIKRPVGNKFEYWRPADMEVIMD